jgi:hypothetical protein
MPHEYRRALTEQYAEQVAQRAQSQSKLAEKV